MATVYDGLVELFGRGHCQMIAQFSKHQFEREIVPLNSAHLPMGLGGHIPWMNAEIVQPLLKFAKEAAIRVAYDLERQAERNEPNLPKDAPEGESLSVRHTSDHVEQRTVVDDAQAEMVDASAVALVEDVHLYPVKGLRDLQKVWKLRNLRSPCLLAPNARIAVQSLDRQDHWKRRTLLCNKVYQLAVGRMTVGQMHASNNGANLRRRLLLGDANKADAVSVALSVSPLRTRIIVEVGLLICFLEIPRKLCGSSVGIFRSDTVHKDCHGDRRSKP